MFRSILGHTRSSRSSAALVVACLALFVAMCGTGYASGLITGKQVKNSSLTGKDVKDDTLTGNDVANESLTGGDLAAGSVSAADVAPDSLGGGVVNEAQLGQVPHAIDADIAADADKLDGHPADYFEPLHGCHRGKVLGFVHVRGNDGSMPGVYTEAPAYVHADFNCTGSSVQARRVAIGQYRVKFLGNPAYIAMAQVRTDSDSTDADLCIGIAKEGAAGLDLNAFEVTVTTCDGASTPRDANFTLLLP
jgi:hypothetical protein